LAKIKSMQAPLKTIAPANEIKHKEQGIKSKEQGTGTVAGAGITKYEYDDKGCAQIQFTCVRVTGQGNQSRQSDEGGIRDL